MDDERDELRNLVEASRDGRGYVRPNAALKERICGYVDRARDLGKTTEALASELGIAKSTLERWRHRHRAGLVPVRVTSPSAGFVLIGPASVRVEGLSVEQLAELVRRLQ